VSLLLGINQRRKRRGLQPNVSKKPKPKRRAPWTDEEEEKLMGTSEEFGGDRFLYSVAIGGQLGECFGMCRGDKMTKNLLYPLVSRRFIPK
jgi:hypothetical protein